jgi:hypothetical protein
MNRERYFAAALACARAAGLAVGLRGHSRHRGDVLALREVDKLRNELATIERLIETDRAETRRAEPVEPAEWGGGQWAEPRLPFGEAAAA